METVRRRLYLILGFSTAFSVGIVWISFHFDKLLHMLPFLNNHPDFVVISALLLTIASKIDLWRRYYNSKALRDQALFHVLGDVVIFITLAALLLSVKLFHSPPPLEILLLMLVVSSVITMVPHFRK